ncbi:TerC/Alx family metal homeostasis membrane protein [Nocardioides agariphilus]|jgi:tellurite resistance protein TerC|uniref:TerC/Alx family metal homeostasis membrane protein n=1 Tax=Nocardioides agariphilus TaxID=433664 RepID=A0A930VLY6_9ACTN|nr:TerC/Alx family metal homeostasis membrane protein [Nocardioides agariphilus]MBF4766300.1 TerC/Alx family metal homeostasis membrane protein [Nocardioides agariphilus]
MHTAVAPQVWVATVLLLAGLVTLDLVMLARRPGSLTLAHSVRWVIAYVLAAVLFGVALATWGPPDTGTEFFAGYVTEYSLSVDNLFVFLLIMAKFDVPANAQDKVLLIGIVFSMLLRGTFITGGSVLVSAASWSFLVFGLLLIYTAIGLLRGDDGPDEYEEFRLLRALRRAVPISDTYDADRLRVTVAGATMWSPIVVAVGAIALADVVFALDSIPAIFGLTRDPYVILSANAFALLGLRQLFFLVEGLLDRLVFLSYGLALILGFIGLKLVAEGLHGSHVEHVGPVEVPVIGIGPSLIFIIVVLTIVSAASLLKRVPAEADLTDLSED